MLALKVLICFSAVKFVLSCNGFSFRSKTARNCLKTVEPIIKLINSSVTVDKNCDVIVSACSEVHAFKTAAMIFKISKNTLTVHESKIDMCDKKKKTDMIAMPLEGLGIPKPCPVTSNYTYCRNNEKVFTLSASTQRLLPTFAAAAREALIHMELTHDNGKSCFEIETIIEKI